MYAFFYSLYQSLFSGTWGLTSWSRARAALGGLADKVGSFVISALGGNYTALQDFTWKTSMDGLDLNIVDHVSALLALITMIGVCLVVWKLTKAVFSIFFSRA